MNTLENFPLTTDQLMDDLRQLKHEEIHFSNILDEVNPREEKNILDINKENISTKEEIIKEIIGLSQNQIMTTLKNSEEEQYNMVSAIYENTYKGSVAYLEVVDWFGNAKVTLEHLLGNIDGLSNFLKYSVDSVKEKEN